MGTEQITDDDSQFIKLISWNVNGAKAIKQKQSLVDYVKQENPDILCIQETKSHIVVEDLLPKEMEKDYTPYWSFCTTKKGYAGTAIFSKIKPIEMKEGIEGKHKDEGRAITLEYKDFYLLATYSPNASEGLKRLGYKQEWSKDIKSYLLKLNKKKPVVWTGIYE